MSAHPKNAGPESAAVGSRLRRLRRLLDLSQRELADRMAESGHPLDAETLRSALARIETSARNVSAEDLVHAAAALKVSPLVLLNDIDLSAAMISLVPVAAVTP